MSEAIVVLLTVTGVFIYIGIGVSCAALLGRHDERNDEIAGAIVALWPVMMPCWGLAMLYRFLRGW